MIRLSSSQWVCSVGEGALLLAADGCSTLRDDDALGFVACIKERFPKVILVAGHPALSVTETVSPRRHLVGLDEALKLIEMLIGNDKANTYSSDAYYP